MKSVIMSDVVYEMRHTRHGVVLELSEKPNPLRDAVKINFWPDGAPHIHTD